MPVSGISNDKIKNRQEEEGEEEQRRREWGTFSVLENQKQRLESRQPERKNKVHFVGSEIHFGPYCARKGRICADLNCAYNKQNKKQVCIMNSCALRTFIAHTNTRTHACTHESFANGSMHVVAATSVECTEESPASHGHTMAWNGNKFANASLTRPKICVVNVRDRRTIELIDSHWCLAWTCMLRQYIQFVLL